MIKSYIHHYRPDPRPAQGRNGVICVLLQTVGLFLEVIQLLGLNKAGPSPGTKPC